MVWFRILTVNIGVVMVGVVVSCGGVNGVAGMVGVVCSTNGRGMVVVMEEVILSIGGVGIVTLMVEVMSGTGGAQYIYGDGRGYGQFWWSEHII